MALTTKKKQKRPTSNVRRSTLNARQLARQIARALLTGGYDTKATRLVMERGTAKLKGGGWCESAIVAEVQRHLEGGNP